jgi:hypothetical protein
MAEAGRDRLLRAALAYAKAGFRVLPLGVRSKLPLIPEREGGRGVLDATTDEFQIRVWWQREAQANIGLASGAGLLVVDIDVRSGKPGREEFFALEQKYGKLPETRTVSTGTGGTHLYFRVPEDFAARGRLAAHVDLRGVGTYVLAPPSVHPDSGIEYTWDGLNGWFQAMAELPQVWLEAARKVPAREPAGDAKQQVAPRLPAILEGCAWLRHTREDAASLPEPEWYAMLSIVARTENGREDAHAFSRPYRGYRPAETEKKIRHALEDAGPVTCARVRSDFGENYCAACSYWGRIESPAVLGLERRSFSPASLEEPAPEAESWRNGLTLNRNRRPHPNVANAAHALREHPGWSGKLEYDAFREKIMLREGLPAAIAAGELEEQRFFSILTWLQRTLTPTLSEGVARAAVELVARSQAVHPLRERIAAESWDGVKRLQENFFLRYFGAQPRAEHRYAEDQALYWDECAVAWFVLAVARIFQPGCSGESILVLEGGRPSEVLAACEALAGDASYLLAQLPSRFEWQASAEQLRGVWLVLLADVGRQLQYEHARQFLTRTHDQYRPAHSRWGKMIYPRQCMFLGTAEEERSYLYGEGMRLVWPVAVGAVDVAGLRRDVWQIWAEALVLYRRGAGWWPKADRAKLFEREQQARLVADPWLEKLVYYSRQNPELSIAKFFEVSGVPLHLQTREMQRRVAYLLVQAGFQAGKDDDGRPVWINREALEAMRERGFVQ